MKLQDIWNKHTHVVIKTYFRQQLCESQPAVLGVLKSGSQEEDCLSVGARSVLNTNL